MLNILKDAQYWTASK